jgi:hypothetical protein
MVTIQINMVTIQIIMVTIKINMVTIQINMGTIQVNMVTIQVNMVLILINMATIQINMATIQINMATIQINMATIQINMVLIQINMAIIQIKPNPNQTEFFFFVFCVNRIECKLSFVWWIEPTRFFKSSNKFRIKCESIFFFCESNSTPVLFFVNQIRFFFFCDSNQRCTKLPYKLLRWSYKLIQIRIKWRKISKHRVKYGAHTINLESNENWISLRIESIPNQLIWKKNYFLQSLRSSNGLVRV